MAGLDMGLKVCPEENVFLHLPGSAFPLLTSFSGKFKAHLILCSLTRREISSLI